MQQILTVVQLILLHADIPIGKALNNISQKLMRRVVHDCGLTWPPQPRGDEPCKAASDLLPSDLRMPSVTVVVYHNIVEADRG